MKLVDAEKRHAEHPRSFHIPELEDRMSLEEEDLVKLGFESEDLLGERLWFEITDVLGPGRYVGELQNYPVTFECAKEITFEAKHVLDIQRA